PCPSIATAPRGAHPWLCLPRSSPRVVDDTRGVRWHPTGERHMNGITERLAAFTTTWDASDIPHRARNEATRALVDVAGTMLAGAAEPRGPIGQDQAREEGGSGQAAVVGGGFRTSPSLAALANGTTGHALDYDDIGLDVGHPTVAVAPAALAVAEHVGASG